MKIRNWLIAIEASLNNLENRNPIEVIDEIVDLGLAIENEDAMLLERHPVLLKHQSALSNLYQKYILDMEEAELNRLTSCHQQGLLFRDVASESAMVAYNRVGDMFEYADFNRCQQFVLIGCGQLPMTALHVNDRTEVPKIICVDISPEAITAIQKLNSCLDGLRLQAVHSDGQMYNFSTADIVYVANMVSPKSAVVSRIVETARDDVQIIVREPYSLGRLWTESVEASLNPQLEVIGRGRGSRYLSRDVFLQKRLSSK